MNKYKLGIDGMACGMCELHVEKAIRNKIKAKRINASHIKNEVVIISELKLTLDDFKKVLDPTGYRITSFDKLEAKKTLFGWR